MPRATDFAMDIQPVPELAFPANEPDPRKITLSHQTAPQCGDSPLPFPGPGALAEIELDWPTGFPECLPAREYHFE
jgi:hypothetical protein